MEEHGFRRSFSPVKVGDELEVTIEAIGEKGDGIAKKEGFVLFVPNTKQDDHVKVKITRVLRKVGFAEVVGEGSSGSESSESAAEEPATDTQAEIEESSEEPAKDEPAESKSQEEVSPNAENSEDTEDFGEEESKEEKE